MKNKFIYSPKKSLFEKKLAAGEIGEGSIVFIEDTKEIWNRGHYFGLVGSGSGIDPEILSGIETAIATLQSDKADKSELSDYAKKDELPSLDGYLTKTVADGLYATIAQYNALNQTVGDIQTELSNKATKDELSTGLAGKLDNSAADGFVPTTRKVNGKALDQDITITATDLNAATKDELGNVNTDLQTFKNNVALTYATDQDVADAVAALVDSSPAALDTLNELAAALGDDPNFATTVATNIGKKADQTALDATNTNVANLTTKVNGNSVSKSGETLTVSINGSSQSLTNTWRSISDAVDSTSTSVSASSKAVKTAYDLAAGAANTSNTALLTAQDKWTYNENTIKNVKVNNAWNADTVGGFTVSTNVPKDALFTDTHYATSIHAGASGATSNSAQTNPYVFVKDSGIYRNQIRLVGGGATTVTSDASGNITISSTDTNTHPTVGNGTVTIKQNGVSKGSFTMNQSGNTTIELTDTDTNTTYSLGSFGITATATELNYTDGVTSNIQTQLNGKQATISDLSTIRSNASNGATAYGWGNHADAGYIKSYTDEKVTNTKSSTTKFYFTGTSSSTTNTGGQYFDTGIYTDTSAGSVYGSAFWETSDERLKDFKEDVEVDFDKLKSIPKKYFTWKEDVNQISQIGTSAQAVQAIYPELVSGDETLHVDYARLVIPALAAIDVLYEENKKLHKENKKLQDRIAKLEEVVYG